jgi:hypothetical protein
MEKYFKTKPQLRSARLRTETIIFNNMKSLKFILVLFGIALVFSSCLKDHCQKNFRMFIPIYKSRAAVLQDVKLQGSQKIEKAGKIFSYGNYLFINDVDKGIHIIDNSNPAVPNKTGFLNIEGNLDLWVRNNLLYADCYDNLLVIDIHDMHNIQLLESLPNVFPQRDYNEAAIDASKGYVVGWQQRDTSVVINCDEKNNISMLGMKGAYVMDLGVTPGASFMPPSGVAGSLTRFNATGTYLYCVDNSNIHTFNIAQQKPTPVSDIAVSWGVETIYSFNNNLFLGTSSGVLIYSLSNPAIPAYINKMQHVRTCDPVITDGAYAFVTLRGGSACGGFANQMDVLDVKNIQNITLVKSYMLTNPYGLGMDNNYVFVCDEGYGIHIFDRLDVNLMNDKYKINIDHPRDIIVLNNTLLVLTDTKMVQYNYSDLNNIKMISEIN